MARNAELLRHYTRVDALRSYMHESQQGLSGFPNALRSVLKNESWKLFEIESSGTEVAYTRFAEFVTAPPLKGLGATVDLLRNLARGDDELCDLLDRELRGEKHVHREVDSDNVTITSQPRGNSTEGALARLRKDRPELHRDVITGRLSAHAAMVAAGYRHKTASIPIDDVNLTARALRRLLSKKQLLELSAALREGKPKS